MATPMIVQGRVITGTDVELIEELLAANPSWGRTRLSEELCKLWGWRTDKGRLRDMACRTLLLKLERGGCIQLPARRRRSTNGFRNRCPLWVSHSTDVISCRLGGLMPLEVVEVSARADELALFKCLLSEYHYLGHRNTVGENMKYLVRDGGGRALACVLFGAAAWKTAPRDAFIGWDARSREANLGGVANNTRFLILPWVQVAHLASHVLSRVIRRVRSDWMEKYGHAVHLLETFVDRSRFHGTCYQAANWICVGQTQGRTRNDRDRSIRVGPKAIYVYPLTRHFRRELCHVHA